MRLAVRREASVKVIDHIAHFVPDIESAAAELEKLGFTLTPLSRQEQNGLPAGTANRCAMLKRGYLEFLTPTADTDMGHQVRAAIARYIGPHLIAIGTSAPESDHQRLAREGFGPLDPVNLQRETRTGSEIGTARFTVIRVPPGTMAEGRIQFVKHHTPELLWKSRWLTHANGAIGLNGVIVCVAEPEEAAERYQRFTGRPPNKLGILFMDPATLERRLNITASSLPWIAGSVLESEDIARSNDYLRAAGAAVGEWNKRLVVKLPSSVGGILVFEPG